MSNIGDRIMDALTGGSISNMKQQLEEVSRANQKLKRDVEAYSGSYNNIFTYSYDGEKNMGELGPAREYLLDYAMLRARSWQALLESEIAQIVLKRFCTWIVGSGLKLQCEPAEAVLNSEKISGFTVEEFNDLAEARFGLWSGARMSSYSDMSTANRLAFTAYHSAIVGGDVLVVQRVIDKTVKIQLIDGAHVCTPFSNYNGMVLENGNRVRNGIEMDKTGKHIAYYVRKVSETGISLETERIEARAKSGQIMAFMIYGLEYRLDNNRGLPLIACMLETMKKLERYKEAVVGSAEERQKIAYFVEHSIGSTGENPFQKTMAKISGFDAGKDDVPFDVQGRQLAENVQATTNKTTVNMPLDSTLKALESKNELYFKDFYSVNIDILCATVEIPPNVAMSKYDSNYSASRAAIKDWEHTINVKRKDFAFQYYEKLWSLFLDVEVLKNKLQAPGYLKAMAEQDMIVLEAWRKARFIGAQVPHIDPEKEVRAERLKLGDSAASIPLTTVERSTENLNGGNSDSNIEQYAEELKFAKRLKIVQDEVAKPADVPAAPEEE